MRDEILGCHIRRCALTYCLEVAIETKRVKIIVLTLTVHVHGYSMHISLNTSTVNSQLSAELSGTAIAV